MLTENTRLTIGAFLMDTGIVTVTRPGGSLPFAKNFTTMSTDPASGSLLTRSGSMLKPDPASCCLSKTQEIGPAVAAFMILKTFFLVVAEMTFPKSQT